MVLNCRVEWSACIDRKQTRTCTDTANCAKTPTRTEELYCAMDTTPPGSIIGLNCDKDPTNTFDSIPILCRWTNPTDSDFKEVTLFVYSGTNLIKIYITSGNSYTFDEILNAGQYKITIKTKDISNNEEQVGISKQCSISADRRYGCT